MQNEPTRRQGPVVATLKVLLVAGAVVLAGLTALAVIGFWVGPPQPPSPDRIREECGARFAEHGEAAVEACVRDLIGRGAEQERQRLLDDAYRASRRSK